MYLSDILLSALNRRALTPREIGNLSQLAERWEIVRIYGGAWARRDEVIWVESVNAYAGPEDVSECDNCCECVLSEETRSVNVLTRGRLHQQNWCEYCADNATRDCGNCGEVFSEQAIDENGFCADCAQSLENEAQGDGNSHPKLGRYHSARPANPYGSDACVYSAELELEGKDGKIFELVEKLHGSGIQRLTTERDGSLDDTLGVEVQLSWRQTLSDLASDLASVAKIAKSCGALSWDAKSAPNVGLHISSNAHSGWTLHRKMRLAFLVGKLRMQLIRIAGRNCEQYAKFLSGAPLRWHASGASTRYVAVHFSGSRIEWRLFRGTLNARRLRLYCDTVQILESLVFSDLGCRKLLRQAEKALAALWCEFVNGIEEGGQD